MSPKFTRDALRALGDPDTGVRTYEMTPERKEKWARIASEFTDFLAARTEGPLEAYAILQMMTFGFEDAFAIRGGMVVENSEKQD